MTEAEERAARIEKIRHWLDTPPNGRAHSSDARETFWRKQTEWLLSEVERLNSYHFRGLIDRDRLAELAAQIPPLSLSAIGLTFGVSGERVRQVLSELGLSKPRVRKYSACVICGDQFPHSGPLKRCPTCLKAWRDQLYVDVPCGCGCGELKRVRRSSLSTPSILANPNRPNAEPKTLVFINKHHQGVWLGNNTGFGARPENFVKGLETRRRHRADRLEHVE